MQRPPVTIVIVPGVDDSGPEHWQSLMQEARPGSVRVQQEDWTYPECDAWIDGIVDTLSALHTPVLFVAHSAGAVTVAHWAERHTHAPGVVGALLVAPPDFETEMEDGIPLDFLEDAGWIPAARSPLPFPTIVIASTNDPYASLDRARGFARDWGAHFLSLEDAGHINTASGFGPWPLADALVEELLSAAR